MACSSLLWSLVTFSSLSLALCQLEVLSPPALRDHFQKEFPKTKGIIQGNTLPLGHPPPGVEVIYGPITYLPKCNTLCDSSCLGDVTQTILFAHEGGCSLEEKLKIAAKAKAACVVVVGKAGQTMRDAKIEPASDKIDTPLLSIDHKSGQDILDTNTKVGGVEIRLRWVTPKPPSVKHLRTAPAETKDEIEVVKSIS